MVTYLVTYMVTVRRGRGPEAGPAGAAQMGMAPTPS
jgi:hypothetical protein